MAQGSPAGAPGPSDPGRAPLSHEPSNLNLTGAPRSRIMPPPISKYLLHIFYTNSSTMTKTLHCVCFCCLIFGGRDLSHSCVRTPWSLLTVTPPCSAPSAKVVVSIRPSKNWAATKVYWVEFMNIPVANVHCVSSWMYQAGLRDCNLILLITWRHRTLCSCPELHLYLQSKKTRIACTSYRSLSELLKHISLLSFAHPHANRTLNEVDIGIFTSKKSNKRNH